VLIATPHSHAHTHTRARAHTHTLTHSHPHTHSPHKHTHSHTHTQTHHTPSTHTHSHTNLYTQAHSSMHFNPSIFKFLQLMRHSQFTVQNKHIFAYEACNTRNNQIRSKLVRLFILTYYVRPLDKIIMCHMYVCMPKQDTSRFTCTYNLISRSVVLNVHITHTQRNRDCVNRVERRCKYTGVGVVSAEKQSPPLPPLRAHCSRFSNYVMKNRQSTCQYTITVQCTYFETLFII
jgi:hypothetical protein